MITLKNDCGLLNLDRHHLEVWKVDQHICVAYRNCYIKDGYALKGEFGIGNTFEEACGAYRLMIAGKTLVFNPGSNNREEVIVL